MGSESHLTLQPPESLLCQSLGGGNVASPFCWKEGHPQVLGRIKDKGANNLLPETVSSQIYLVPFQV